MGDSGRQGREYCLSKWLSAFWSKMIKLKLNLFAEFRITNDDIFTVWILDSGLHVLDSVIRVLNSEFFVSGTWILDVIVKGIPESLNRVFRIPKPSIPDSTIKIPRFRNPDSLTLGTPFLCSLLSRRLEKVAAKKNGRARGRHACLFRAHYFLPPLPHASPSITQPWQYSAPGLSGIIFKTYCRRIP